MIKTINDLKSLGPFAEVGDYKRARERFNKIIAAGDLEALLAAREAYAVVARRRVQKAIARGETPAEAKQYIQHLCTFLGRWRDFLPDGWVPPLLKAATPAQSAVIHWHRCKPCDRRWKHSGTVDTCPTPNTPCLNCDESMEVYP